AFLALLPCANDGLSARRFAESLSLGQLPTRDSTGAPPIIEPTWTPPREETLAPGQLSLIDLFEANVGTQSPSREEEPRVAQADSTVRAPRQWEALLVESAVIGGVDRWARRLNGLAQELQLRIDEQIYSDGESAAVAALQRDRAQFDELRRFALPVIEELAALPELALWGEWLDRLDALAPRVLRHPERVLALLAELRPMAAVGPLTLPEVREVLTPRLA